MDREMLLLIAGMSLVTYLPRVLPLLYGAKTEMSPSLRRWIQYVPVAVFGALVFPDIFFTDGVLMLSPLTNLKIVASVLAFAVAVKTKSMLWSIVAGVGCLWLLTIFL